MDLVCQQVRQRGGVGDVTWWDDVVLLLYSRYAYSAMPAVKIRCRGQFSGGPLAVHSPPIGWFGYGMKSPLNLSPHHSQ